MVGIKDLGIRLMLEPKWLNLKPWLAYKKMISGVRTAMNSALTNIDKEIQRTRVLSSPFSVSLTSGLLTSLPSVYTGREDGGVMNGTQRVSIRALLL